MTMKRETTSVGDRTAPVTVRMDLSPAVIISAVQRMKKADREVFLEELLAASSPRYLAGIREARAQYAAGKKHSHERLFGAPSI
ncbi:MAG: hypothetical protein EDX89_15315 [Acidobacteria bacterium]|nr:MAG: hypothetical protein EDX89_15315 [Acidobacteriota bacterium]MCE7956618.1 hypothetical protein [Acidobacteria bacterium ACB2]